MRALLQQQNGLMPSLYAAFWNDLLKPQALDPGALGKNWIDPNYLSPSGVGDLSQVPGVEYDILDNRHISKSLKDMLCQNESTEGSDIYT